MLYVILVLSSIHPFCAFIRLHISLYGMVFTGQFLIFLQRGLLTRGIFLTKGFLLKSWIINGDYKLQKIKIIFIDIEISHPFAATRDREYRLCFYTIYLLRILWSKLLIASRSQLPIASRSKLSVVSIHLHLLNFPKQRLYPILDVYVRNYIFIIFREVLFLEGKRL